jgi:hypothetical protein
VKHPLGDIQRHTKSESSEAEEKEEKKTMINFVAWWLFDLIVSTLVYLIGFPIALVILGISYSKNGKKAFALPVVFKAVSPLPLGLGTRVIGKVAGLVNPYGASIAPLIDEWTSTSAVIRMDDRPWSVPRVLTPFPPLVFCCPVRVC